MKLIEILLNDFFYSQVLDHWLTNSQSPLNDYYYTVQQMKWSVLEYSFNPIQTVSVRMHLHFFWPKDLVVACKKMLICCAVFFWFDLIVHLQTNLFHSWWDLKILFKWIEVAQVPLFVYSSSVDKLRSHRLQRNWIYWFPFG